MFFVFFIVAFVWFNLSSLYGFLLKSNVDCFWEYGNFTIATKKFLYFSKSIKCYIHPSH